MKNNNVLEYDVSIIGAGPAGLTCAIYVLRGNLSACFIDKGAPGGKMTKTYSIENWTGEQKIHGADLSLKMLNHAKAVGAHHVFGNVIKIENKSEFEHYTYLDDGIIIKSKAIVVATGMNNKIPKEIPRIEELEFKGISYCVVCDSPLYKNKPAAIIGGGDSAFEEALYLASVASKVYIFVRKSYAKAEKIMVDEIKKLKNVEILYNSEITELIGKDKLTKIKYIKDDKEYYLDIDHLYPYIGFIPSNEFIKELPIFDEIGFILTNKNMETIIPGLYAIGDIRHKNVRQIITAANDGAIAGKIITNKIKK